MSALKWTWKIIWRLVLVPIIFTFIVMIISMLFINDVNQDVERRKAYDANYGTSYQQYRDQSKNNPSFVNRHNMHASRNTMRYSPKRVEMEDSDFDLTGVISTIALFGSFIVMLAYTIMDIRDQRKLAK